MRVMVMVKATADSEAGVMPTEREFAAMASYNEELVKAGIMLAGEGLHPSSNGFRVRFSGDKLEGLVDAINATGYGLTLGIHSRLDSTVERVRARARVGNVYVNRGMIGAVVGVQPFGGEGLSGTGPKAGGPLYVPRFAVERALSVNTAAAGGNAALMALGEE